MCTNGLFAVSAESGNLVLWDIEERKPSFVTPLKNVFQFHLHSAETMVRKSILNYSNKRIFSSYLGFSFNL
jgi:hypothetical protein